MTAITLAVNPTTVSPYAAMIRAAKQTGVSPAADFTALSAQTAAHAKRLAELVSYEALGNRVGLGTVYLLDYADPAAADHTVGFQAAVNAAIAINGGLNLRGFTTINLSDTINWLPLPGKSEYKISVDGPATIQWIGGSNKVVHNIVGMRFSSVTNVGTGIRNGVHDVYIWDLDTAAGTPNIDSTSQIDFIGCGALLGNGVNNCCFRFGHKSGAGADISNVRISRAIFFGVQAGFPGGVPAGMTALKFEGPNVLTNAVSNCLFAYVGYGITTKTQASGLTPAQYGSYTDGNGNTHDGAGGIVVGEGTVWSHCIQDILYPSIQSLILTGTRHEDSQHFLDVPDNYNGGTITLNTIQIDNCAGVHPDGNKSGCIGFIGGPYSVLMPNPNVRNGAVYQYLFKLNSYSGRNGKLIIDGGFLPVGDSFIRRGNATDGSSDPASSGKTPAWKLYFRGVTKLNQYGDYNGDLADYAGN